jgi:hypothetical protein
MDNLKEIPQEREYMRNLLKEKRFEPLSIRESVEVKGGDL